MVQLTIQPTKLWVDCPTPKKVDQMGLKMSLLSSRVRIGLSMGQTNGITNIVHTNDQLNDNQSS